MKDFDPGLLLKRAMPHLPLVAVWIMAIALGIQAALLVRHFIPHAPASAPTVGTSPLPRRVQPVDFQGILAAHLFGAAGPDSGPTADPSNAPQTQLSLVLTGVIADIDPQKGLGIIGESATSAKVYAVGAQVPGGVRLHGVYLDRVVLDRNGQLETLMLPRQSWGGTAPGNAAPAPAGAAFTDRVRQMVDSDPNAISEVMRPQPVFANGQQRGYRVYPGRNRQQFIKLGLKPGDLILSLNGTPLDDPARGMEVFNTMGNASEVHVTVEREGRSQELTLNMAQLATQAQELQDGNRDAGAQPVEQAEQIPPPTPSE